MKVEKLIDLFHIIIILWLCCIIVLVVMLFKTANKIEQHIIINTDEKDATNEIIEEPIISNYQTRLTSFYANDGYGTGSCTGTGLCESDFQVNENGWYTYQGKLVLATATPYLANQGWHIADGVHLYKYYDEIILNIDGVDYEGIVVDSCGNCCETDRVDLFVSNAQSVKDTIITVKTK